MASEVPDGAGNKTKSHGGLDPRRHRARGGFQCRRHLQTACPLTTMGRPNCRAESTCRHGRHRGGPPVSRGGPSRPGTSTEDAHAILSHLSAPPEPCLRFTVQLGTSPSFALGDDSSQSSSLANADKAPQSSWRRGSPAHQRRRHCVAVPPSRAQRQLELTQPVPETAVFDLVIPTTASFMYATWSRLRPSGSPIKRFEGRIIGSITHNSREPVGHDA